MSRLLILILPAPADLDAIRAVLVGHFRLNPKVEELGEVEELQAGDENGGVTIFETMPFAAPSNVLSEQMRARGLDPLGYRFFIVKLPGREAQDVSTVGGRTGVSAAV